MECNRLINIKGDGNCLFRAISYLLYKTQRRHRTIRLQTASRIFDDWQFYKDFIPNCNSPEQYREILSKDGAKFSNSSLCYDYK